MTEYTSFGISKKLADAGFKERAEYGYWQLGATDVIGSKIRSSANWGPRDTRLVCRAYRSDTLLAWLMTELPFSKRAQSVCVERVLLHAKDDHATYRAIATTVSGIHIGLALTPPDALAEVVLKIMEKA